MRTLQHTGEQLHPRIQSVSGTCRSVQATLQPGRPLLEQIRNVLLAHGTEYGFAEIYRGSYEPVVYCVPAEGDGVERAVGFSDQRDGGKVSFAMGSVTIGKRFGDPFLHCHSFWLDDAAQARGGHLFPETLIGSAGFTATIYPLNGVQWHSADDTETNMPVFTPSKVEAADSSSEDASESTDVIISRVLPNEDITEAAIQVLETAEWESATVKAGLGSLIGATFVDTQTGTRHAPGPGTEVIALSGVLEHANGEWSARLSCTLVDCDGIIHTGELVRGDNPVAITFELTLLRM